MGSFFTPIEPIKPMSFEKNSETIITPAEGASPIPFADVLRDAVSTYEDTQKAAEQDGRILSVGDVNDLAQLQINSMKAQAALSTTVQLTSRAVNAYKEIMQIQV